MKRSGMVALLLLAALGLAGCGSSAQAAAEPNQAADVGYVTVSDSSGPGAPVKAPTFHSSDAERILPSRLVIPAIKLDTKVVELGWSTKATASGDIFSEWDVAAYAAGWHKNSALPGERGNIVMSGHNNILGSVFRELDQLKRGDEIDVYAGGKKYKYAVDEVLILPEKFASAKQRQANVHFIQETPDERLTLVSCWPRDNNTHRIVVIAKPTATAQTN